jgi:hypothetical protein
MSNNLNRQNQNINGFLPSQQTPGYSALSIFIDQPQSHERLAVGLTTPDRTLSIRDHQGEAARLLRDIEALL